MSLSYTIFSLQSIHHFYNLLHLFQSKIIEALLDYCEEAEEEEDQVSSSTSDELYT